MNGTKITGQVLQASFIGCALVVQLYASQSAIHFKYQPAGTDTDGKVRAEIARILKDPETSQAVLGVPPHLRMRKIETMLRDRSALLLYHYTQLMGGLIFLTKKGVDANFTTDSVELNDKRDHAYVSCFFVDKELRGQGIGKMIVKETLAQLPKLQPALRVIQGETLVDNVRARKLYESLGGRAVGEFTAKSIGKRCVLYAYTLPTSKL